MRPAKIVGCILIVAFVASVGGEAAQQAARPPSASPTALAANESTNTVTLPRGYVIGVADMLSIVFWRDKDMSADVTVRPDGKISLPLINEIDASGSTPEQLRLRLVEAARRFIADPDVTVVVKEIKSRNVFITGSVAKPSGYALAGDMTVMQLIAVSGGLLEYADDKNIEIIRQENGHELRYKFNYKDVVRRRGSSQNITLKPGDTVVVP